MRIAFTIVYEGLHHLEHKDFTENMLSMFDYWIIIEGHAKNGGSTNWCKDVDLPVNSTDGTCKYLNDLCGEHKKVFYIQAREYWQSKDDQVNMAISIVRDLTAACYLWQVDVDEHWKLEDIKEAEHRLHISGYRQADFQFNHFVGEGKVAIGDWGSGYATRLFLWRGENFATHEPARLVGINEVLKINGIKFDHYSYYFEKDITLKEKYYGYEGLLKRWKRLQYIDAPKIPITALFSHRSKIGKSRSSIVKLRK